LPYGLIADGHLRGAGEQAVHIRFPTATHLHKRLPMHSHPTNTSEPSPPDSASTTPSPLEIRLATDTRLTQLHIRRLDPRKEGMITLAPEPNSLRVRSYHTQLNIRLSSRH
jgi:hypothetical protein